MKCGWWASTIDMSQFESLKVTKPPVPASLPLNCAIASKNSGFCSVTVNDSQQDCAMQLLKAPGLLKPGRFVARFSHSVQPPPSVLLRCGGASLIQPRLDESGMEVGRASGRGRGENS